MTQSPIFISKLEIIKDEKDKSNTTVNSSNYNTIMRDMSIGLTAYETICSPREISDESKISFSKDQINRVIEEVLRCNICYNLFQNPVNVKGCLHKFCKSCIMDYYFKVKKECAICRHPIETKRLLKDDNKIKEIIDCFIPDPNKFKDEEDKILAKKAKEYIFKEEQKKISQIEKMKNNEENELTESNLTNNNDQSSASRNHSHHFINRKTHRDNHHNSGLKNSNKDKLSNSMAMFILINTASLQIIPTTVISIRNSLGSENPTKIILAVWISTIVAFSTAIIAGKILIKKM